jgi:hypothetical protein
MGETCLRPGKPLHPLRSNTSSPAPPFPRCGLIAAPMSGSIDDCTSRTLLLSVIVVNYTERTGRRLWVEIEMQLQSLS